MTGSAHIAERAPESLWWLVAAPAIWLGHFLLSYATVAIWCAKLAGPERTLGMARLIVGGYTGLALVGLALVGVRSFKNCRPDGSGEATIPGAPHELAAPGDRRRFLARAVLLLAGLSAVAVVYAALVVVVLRSCT